MTAWRGIFAAVATPFTADAEQVDQTALRALVDHLIANGVHGLVTAASTGECAAMSLDERRIAVEAVIDQAAGRVPVVANATALTTRDAIALARHAKQGGADGLVLLGPYYEPISTAEITRHFATVAATVDLPIIIYNHPGATGYSLSPETIVQLASSIDNVRYVKDTTGDMERLQRLMQLAGDGLTVFNGADTLAFAAFATGTVGAIWGMANAAPRQCVDLFEALVEQRDLDRARELWAAFYPLLRYCEQGPYIAAVKAATTMQGIDVGVPRLPVMPLSAEQTAELGTLLEAVGLRGAGSAAAVRR